MNSELTTAWIVVQVRLCPVFQAWGVTSSQSVRERGTCWTVTHVILSLISSNTTCHQGVICDWWQFYSFQPVANTQTIPLFKQRPLLYCQTCHIVTNFVFHLLGMSKECQSCNKGLVEWEAKWCFQGRLEDVREVCKLGPTLTIPREGVASSSTIATNGKARHPDNTSAKPP